MRTSGVASLSGQSPIGLNIILITIVDFVLGPRDIHTNWGPVKGLQVPPIPQWFLSTDVLDSTYLRSCCRSQRCKASTPSPSLSRGRDSTPNERRQSNPSRLPSTGKASVQFHESSIKQHIKRLWSQPQMTCSLALQCGASSHFAFELNFSRLRFSFMSLFCHEGTPISDNLPLFSANCAR
jgi:hypothetical protein